MRKNFLILFLVFVYIWSWSIFNAVNAAENKTQAIVGHVITETIKAIPPKQDIIISKIFTDFI